MPSHVTICPQVLNNSISKDSVALTHLQLCEPYNAWRGDQPVDVKRFPYGALVNDILVVADLHLGYEDALRERGVELPYEQYPWIKKEILRYLDEYNPEIVVLNGDIKHEFGGALSQEWREVLDLLRTLKSRGIKIEVVRGNHDNYLIPILLREGIEIKDPYLVIDGIMFFHGHKDLLAVPEGVELIVMGHEHPAIALMDDLGGSHRFKAFLEGKYLDIRLLVIPALSPLAPGTDIIKVGKESLLSPLLRRAELDEFTVYIADEEVGVEMLGPLRVIKRAARVL
ncbi:MAG TPA: metallophosphoesterase [Candidatus Korarchaeota archaeon]|nr:metallophosphoesterase [Candidatus Korarchaeota archaeon]